MITWRNSQGCAACMTCCTTSIRWKNLKSDSSSWTRTALQSSSLKRFLARLSPLLLAEVVDYRKGGPRNFLRAPISLPRYSLSFQKRITPQLGESEFQILLIKRCDESGHQGKLIFPWKIILVAERMSQRTRCNDFLLHFGIIP